MVRQRRWHPSASYPLASLESSPRGGQVRRITRAGVTFGCSAKVAWGVDTSLEWECQGEMTVRPPSCWSPTRDKMARSTRSACWARAYLSKSATQSQTQKSVIMSTKSPTDTEISGKKCVDSSAMLVCCTLYVVHYVLYTMCCTLCYERLYIQLCKSRRTKYKW
jgi:hypothetical protein